MILKYQKNIKFFKYKNKQDNLLLTPFGNAVQTAFPKNSIFFC
jgi:hypothetical protein